MSAILSWDDLEDGEPYAVGRFLRFQNIALYDTTAGTFSGPQAIDSIEIVFVPDAAKTTFSSIFTSNILGVVGSSSYGVGAITEEYYNSGGGTGSVLVISGSTYDLRPFTSSFHDSSGTASYSVSSSFVYTDPAPDYVRIKTAGLAASTDSVGVYSNSIFRFTWLGTQVAIQECDKLYVTNMPTGYDAIMLGHAYALSGIGRAYFDDGTQITSAEVLDWNNYPLTLNISGGPRLTGPLGTYVKPQVYIRVRFNALAYNYSSGTPSVTVNTDAMLPFSDGDTVYLERMWS